MESHAFSVYVCGFIGLSGPPPDVEAMKRLDDAWGFMYVPTILPSCVAGMRRVAGKRFEAACKLMGA